MNDKKQERWIYAVALLIPVVWLALLTAPCLGGSIVDVMKRLTEAIKSPLHIVWCKDSILDSDEELRVPFISRQHIMLTTCYPFLHWACAEKVRSNCLKSRPTITYVNHLLNKTGCLLKLQ
nr:hypothetical protein [Clostridia bacterium]